MSRVRAQDRIREIARARPGRALCTHCLASLVQTGQRVVEDAVRRIEGDAEFRRFYGTCSECSRDRLVLSLRSPASTSR